MKSVNRPSKLIERILSAVFKKELLEEILGDLEEYHYELQEQPKWKRRLFYWFEILNFLRPFALKRLMSINLYNPTIMFRNYFKISLRSLLKNPMSSFINIFGLSVAIGVSLVVFSFLQYSDSIDQFHENKDNLFLVTFMANQSGQLQQYGNSPTPMGELIGQDFQQVDKVCRLKDKVAVVKKGTLAFQETIRHVDSTFLEMLTFPMKWGEAASLKDINSIILSEPMSIKLFGNKMPIGEMVDLVYSSGVSKSFQVTGVAEAFPINRTVEFGYLVNFENLKVADPSFQTDDWASFVDATLIQVNKPNDIYAIEKKMQGYQQLQNNKHADWDVETFILEPFATLHHRSRDILKDFSFDAYYEGRVVLPIVAFFMVILACFNYINIAIVSAAKRLKEIGVRKVMGAHKNKVVVQFLFENIFIMVFALLIGVFLNLLAFLPWFVNLSDLPLTFSLFEGELWVFMLSLLLFTGIISGLYPSFYIAKFDIIQIFKGSVQYGKKNVATKIFLCFQLILAFVGITGGVMFTQNSMFQLKQSWGYEKELVIYAPIPNLESYERLKQTISKYPNITSISGSYNHLGANIANEVARFNNQNFEVSQLAVDANYLETMGLSLKSGRFFREHQENEKQFVVVNEELVDKFALTDPIGTRIELDSIKYEVIGVLKNYHMMNFYYEITPAIMKLADKEDYRFLSMKVNPNNRKSVYETLQNDWKTIFPDQTFNGGYQEDTWGIFIEQMDIMQRFNRAIALVSVILAALGLYGLVVLNISGRTKEFCVRKVLGANLPHITGIIMKQYVWLTLLALIFGAPLSFVLIRENITMMFAYPMPMDGSGVVIALLILILVIFVVIATQIRKVATNNAVEGLRD